MWNFCVASPPPTRPPSAPPRRPNVTLRPSPRALSLRPPGAEPTRQPRASTPTHAQSSSLPGSARAPTHQLSGHVGPYQLVDDLRNASWINDINSFSSRCHHDELSASLNYHNYFTPGGCHSPRGSAVRSKPPKCFFEDAATPRQASWARSSSPTCPWPHTHGPTPTSGPTPTHQWRARPTGGAAPSDPHPTRSQHLLFHPMTGGGMLSNFQIWTPAPRRFPPARRAPPVSPVPHGRQAHVFPLWRGKCCQIFKSDPS